MTISKEKLSEFVRISGLSGVDIKDDFLIKFAELVYSHAKNNESNINALELKSKKTQGA